MANKPAFKSFHLAWTFHRNTSRWVHNSMLSNDGDDTPLPSKEYPNLPFSKLPPPADVDESMTNLIRERCSCREFSVDPISTTDISTLLHHALGIWGKDYWGASEFLERPAPSGGGMYPLELYILSKNITDLKPGVHHYTPNAHGLEEIREVELPENLLRYLFMGQYPVTQASCIILIAADTNRSMKKYGDRGYRYLLLEAGHVAQNINLVSTGLGLQSLNIGGFFDDELAQLCCLDQESEILLYAVAIGKGNSTDKHVLRFSD